ncbi:MAG: hypothetical protein ACREIA_18115, partial [Opitutaceae bacterium]
AMNSYERIWNRLVARARGAGSIAAAVEPPPGFVTRVAALGLAARREGSVGSAWEWLAVRGLGIACIVTALALAVAWPVMRDAGQNDLADLADLLVVADASR